MSNIKLFFSRVIRSSNERTKSVVEQVGGESDVRSPQWRCLRSEKVILYSSQYLRFASKFERY